LAIRLGKSARLQSLPLVYESGTPKTLLCFSTADPSHPDMVGNPSAYLLLLLCMFNLDWLIKLIMS